MTADAHEDPVPLAARVIALLRAQQQTVVAAESLTGGLLAAALTEPPGASQAMLGAVVAYAPEVKVTALGVPEEVLSRHGVVSSECAAAMADGARRGLGADWAAATTGVAGPGPDVDPTSGAEQAAGTVHIAVSAEVAGEEVRRHRLLDLPGSRTEVRHGTVVAALQLLLDTLRACVSVGEGTLETPPSTGGDAEEV